MFSGQLLYTTRGGILPKFYLEYMRENPELFLVGIDKDRVIGFCMGYLMENGSFMRKFVKHNIIRVVFKCAELLITGNKQIKQKFSNSRKKENWTIINEDIQSYSDDEMGDLLSICVLPEYRGDGTAQQLIEHYVDVLRLKGRSVCLLTVDPVNKRAVRFYERNLFKTYRRNSTSVTYAKILK